MRRCAILVVLALAAGVAPAARADGDPASDYLVGQNVFFGLTQPHRAATTDLQAAVEAVYARGFRVHVALIRNRTDLGSIPSLFGRPAAYARFLGFEIRPYYIGPLLIVMPGGFGIYDGGRSTAAESAVLAHRTPRGSTPDALALAAASAVRDLRLAGALRSKDILAPSASTFSGTGKSGGTMKLRYTVADDSGRSAVTLRVLHGQTQLAQIAVPMRRVAGIKTYSISWRVPSGLGSGPARLCITARDPSGNRSRQFCTPIELHA